MPRKPPQSLSRVRVPALRQRPDGRWFCRTRVGGKEKDKYFGRAKTPKELEAIARSYASWSLSFASAQLERARTSPLPTSHQIPKPQCDYKIFSQCFEAWFEEIKNASAFRKAKHNVRNKTHGRFDKSYYAARHLSEIVLALEPKRIDQLDITVAEEIACRAKRAVSCTDPKFRWSRQKLGGVVRMVAAFARWALSRAAISTSFATALQQRGLFKAAQASASHDKSRKTHWTLNDQDLHELRGRLAENPMWELVFEIQLLNGARASEVLGLCSAQKVFDQGDLLEFSIPHKTDYHDFDGDRRLVVTGACLARLRWVIATVGSDCFFNCRTRALMRELGGDSISDPRGNSIQYSRCKVRATRYNHNDYRKQLRRYRFKCGTHAIRRCAITAVAHSAGNDAAMDFAGHKDPRMLRRYVETDHVRNRDIIRGRAKPAEMP